MSAKAVVVALLGTVCSAQSLYLRYGGPDSVYHVKNVSADNPSVITVFRNSDYAQVHDLTDGQLVWLQFVPGCLAYSGVWVVADANPSGGTFTLRDREGNPFRCTTFDPTYESGLVGKVMQVTLRSTRPRIFLPASGPILERSKDPDGSGPQVAPVVTENGPAWQRIISRLSNYITPGCDGATPALCPNEENTINRDEYAYRAFAAAYVWFADNNQTGYLNLAKYIINHFHRAAVGTTGAFLAGLDAFPCDQTAGACGLGSGADWISGDIAHISMAYDLIRDQLSSEERAAFAEKMLNGFDGSGCTNALQKQAGSANLTQGSKVVTGSGFSVYGAGDWVYFKTDMAINTVGRWAKVISVTSDSEMTVNFVVGTSTTSASDVTRTGVDHYKVMRWQSGQCGANFIAAGMIDNVPAAQPRAVTTLAAGIDSTQTTITVTSAADFFDPPPFYIVVNSAEVMRVTAMNGNTLTVERGQAYSTPRETSAGKPVVWERVLRGWNDLRTTGPRAYLNDFHHNLVGYKAIGYLISAFALAGDDPRAAEYAQRIWNYYYDLIYPLNKRYWSGPTQGGLQNYGYQYGRWQSIHLFAGLLSRHAFNEGAIDILEDYFFRGITTQFLWTPPGGPNHWTLGPTEPTASSTPLDWRYTAWAAAAATFKPGDASSWWQYWSKNLANIPWQDVRYAPVVAAFCPADAPTTEFRSVMNPWSFHTDTDYVPDEYYGLLVSKKDWSETAGMLLANVGWHWPVDHTVDQGTYVPGGYAIWKGAKLLFGWDVSSGVGGSASQSPWLALASGSSSLKSVAHPPWYSGSAGSQQNKVDRRHADQRYVYARGNFTASWRAEAKVLRQHRHFVHWKSEPEYVVVYDDAELSSGGNATSALQYFHRSDAAAQFTASQDYRQMVLKKPTGEGAMITTRVLLPDESNPTATYTQTSNVHRVTFQWTGVSRIQMITVHRIALGTSDTMEVTPLPGLDPESVGFESESGGEPFAMVFPRNGRDRTECTFTTNFARQGWILVTGLAPGKYRVFRDGQELDGSPFEVLAGDGTLLVAGEAGAYFVSSVPPATLAVDPQGLRFEYEIGGEVPATRALNVTCTGGSCTVTVAEDCPWLSVSPASGATPLELTVGVNPEGLEVGSYSCTVTITAAALGSPQQIAVVLDVTQGNSGGATSEITVEPAGATSRGLLVRYGGKGLQRNQSCTVELSQDATWDHILETWQDQGGLARRFAIFGSSGTLSPSSVYYVRATCGTMSATAQLATRASSPSAIRRVRFQGHPPAGLGAARMRVDYGETYPTSNSQTGECAANGCLVEVELPSDRLIYFRSVYLDAAGRELRISRTGVVAVP
jgi:hypothetical protein